MKSPGYKNTPSTHPQKPDSPCHPATLGGGVAEESQEGGRRDRLLAAVDAQLLVDVGGVAAYRMFRPISARPVPRMQNAILLKPRSLMV